MAKRRKQEKLPSITAHKAQRKERKCLKCNGVFMSKSPGNRICSKCKRLMSGTELPVVYKTQVREENL